VELKKLMTHFTYRIESKPEGGFIARATDPSLPPLEALTRMELQQKIQANIASALANEFPGLKLPLQNQMKIEFHIERKLDGTFDIHHPDSSAPAVQGASHEEVESKFAEKLLNMVGKHLAPEISQAIGAQLASGNVKVFVTKNVKLDVKSMPAAIQDNALSGPVAGDNSPANEAIISNANLGINPNDSSPITPERDNSSTFFRFLLAVLVLAAAFFLYLLLHR
jgi:hypothetical protein